MEQLPPRIPDPALFALITDVLSVQWERMDPARLRLRFLQTSSWQRVFEVAGEQQLTAPLTWALVRHSLLLPVPTVSSVGLSDPSKHPTKQILASYQTYLQRRNRQKEQLTAVVRSLNADGIVPLLLKGARYLLQPTGAWCEARDMRDLDVMVCPHEAARAMHALIKSGYGPAEEYLPNPHHLPELWHSSFRSAVEIHTDALALSAQHLLGTDEVRHRGIRSTSEGIAYDVLPREWHLLHALLHHQISDRGHRREILAAAALWEFACLGSELSEPEWQAIAGQLSARGASDLLGSWIALAEQLYGLECPMVIQISPAARRHAARTLANASAPDWWRRARFLADQLRFAFAGETLATRYPDGRSFAGLAFRHARSLLRRYRGRMGQRLLGR